MNEKLIAKYKALWETPLTCEPLVQVDFPVQKPYTLGQALDDPAKMFENQMTEFEARRNVGDDFLPSLRADFGTAQIPAMFGCPLRIAEDTEPCCSGHILTDIMQVHTLENPPMTAGWMPRVDAFQNYFLAHKPQDVAIRHPDVQGPFNTAHLLRGNDILFDLYDYPEEVKLLLNHVADFMAEWIKYVKRDISNEPDWFFDSGGLWHGGARMCNCSLQFVSPSIYREFIKEADECFLGAVGGGRIHYCGTFHEVLSDLFALKNLTTLEVDAQYHDIIQTCEMAPQQTSVMFCDWSTDPGNGPWYDKLINGAVPQKKNIVLMAKAKDSEDAKRVYDELKNCLCK